MYMVEHAFILSRNDYFSKQSNHRIYKEIYQWGLRWRSWSQISDRSHNIFDKYSTIFNQQTCLSVLVKTTENDPAIQFSMPSSSAVLIVTWYLQNMMTPWHDNASHITDPLWGEPTGDRWIPLAKGQWCGALVPLLPYWTRCGQTIDLT